MRVNGLLLVVLVGLLCGVVVLWGGGPDSATAPAALFVPDDPVDASEVVLPNLESAEPGRLQSAPVELVSQPEPPSTIAGLAPAADRLPQLVRDLEALLADDPDGAALALGAPRLLETFAAEEQSVGSTFLGRLQHELESPMLDARVRGALMALWPRLANGEAPPDVTALAPWERLGYRLGELAAWHDSGEPGLAIDLAIYYEGGVDPVGPRLLAFTLDRLPSDAVAQEFAADLAMIAETETALFNRELAVFALGTSLGKWPWVLELFLSLLADDTAYGGQLRFPILFVMSRSDDPLVQQRLLEFLDRGTLDQLELGFARLWLGDRPTSWPSVVELAKPLLTGGTLMDNMGAAAALGTQYELAVPLGGQDPERVERLEELMGEIVEANPDENVRSALLAILGSYSKSGQNRLRLLTRSLHEDTSANVRLLAVNGLRRTQGPGAAAARAELQARSVTETDPAVKLAIQEALEP
ncbi:MAG: hypothetical protein DHS20C15_20380 [Planctomycetota bacterium]|nr:MAG: hypothetical protein DHS20C15_20380 [Planctomycetota bacterium]